ncbi:Fc receptor-like protein 2 isoform X2 [Mustelus asterias]
MAKGRSWLGLFFEDSVQTRWAELPLFCTVGIVCFSGSCQLNQIKAYDTTITLEIKPQHVLIGDSIVLECLNPSLERTDYSLEWYQNDTFLRRTYDNQISIEKAKHSDGGSYHCEFKTTYRTCISKDIYITVTDLCSPPLLKVDPEVEIFVGQQLNLICSAGQLQTNYPLLYSFFNNEQRLNLPAEQNYYLRELAVLGDSGYYQCEVTTPRSAQKKLSNAVSVLVKLIPVSKPDLELQPRSEIIQGEAVTLTCSVSTGSSPIKYVFYNNLTNEIHWEISNHSRIAYEMANVSKRAEGNYNCRVSNQVSENALYSESIPLAVVVPVGGAVLNSNTNKTEISIGDPLVMQCQLKEGTFPQFIWYLNHQQLENISEHYNFSTDGRQLNIHSFQIRYKGRYRCVAMNRGPDEVIFNTTSNYIDITVPAQSHTAAITTTVIPLLLIIALLAYLCYERRNKNRESSSNISPQLRDTTGNIPQHSGEKTSTSNFEYAVVGKCRNTNSDSFQPTYCAVSGPRAVEDTTESDAGLVYAVVKITKSSGAGNSGGTAGGKQDNKKGVGDSCITYATLNHHNNENNLQGNENEEGDVYENLPRHS